jgi:5'-3' exonuclease
MIHIYDANNYFRRMMEDTTSSLPLPRRAYVDASTAKHVEVYVWDGYNHNARRREFFPGYKIRPPVSEDIYSGLNFLRQILIHTPAVQVEVPEWEADDVIGVLARDWARKGHQVTVHSNDLDYFQLLDTPGISLPGVKNPSGVPAKYLPLYKTLVGDPSDKIPGIPNFGPKAFEALEAHWDTIIEYIEHKGWYDDVPFKPKHYAWCIENQDLIYAYWKIVHLWNVPLDLIEKHTYAGIPNPAAAETLLRKYML